MSTQATLYIDDVPNVNIGATTIGITGGSQPHSNFQPYSGSTGAGISIINARAISLDQMTVQNGLDDGVRLSGVNNAAPPPSDGQQTQDRPDIAKLLFGPGGPAIVQLVDVDGGVASNVPTVVDGLTTVNANVAADQQFQVLSTSLLSDESLTFNGSAETDGKLYIASGAGNDIIAGGNLTDTIHGGAGADQLYGPRDGNGVGDFLIHVNSFGAALAGGGFYF